MSRFSIDYNELDEVYEFDKHLAGKHDQSSHANNRQSKTGFTYFQSTNKPKTIQDIIAINNSLELQEFTKNHFKLDNAYSPEVVAAQNYYVGLDENTLVMNEALRLDKTPAENVAMIDEWTNSSEALADVRVYRGVILPAEVHERMQVGATFTDKGFQSTAINREQTAMYMKVRQADGAIGDRVTLRIDVPKGQKVAHGGQGEIVLPRNLEMKVISRDITDKGSIVLAMEILNGNS